MYMYKQDCVFRIGLDVIFFVRSKWLELDGLIYPSLEKNRWQQTRNTPYTVSKDWHCIVITEEYMARIYSLFSDINGSL